MIPWAGTWINTDYIGGDFNQKIVNHPDGTVEGFSILTITIAGFIKKVTILDKWLDSIENYSENHKYRNLLHTLAHFLEKQKTDNRKPGEFKL